MDKTTSKGMFFALEGGEATGKSTTAKELKKRLERKGYEVVLTREPGGIPSAEAIRGNIIDFHVDPKTELLLFLAARREHLMNKVVPALESGKIVISDRFHLSSLVYQGYARGLGVEEVRRLNEYVCGDLLPHMNILIDIPVDVSMERKAKEKEINRLDLEGRAFHQMVEDGYRQLAEAGNDPITVVDGTLPLSEMIDAVESVVQQQL